MQFNLPPNKKHTCTEVNDGNFLKMIPLRFPKKLWWGTAHASVPPIFGVVLWSARENTKSLKNGEMKEFVVVKWRVLLRKGHIIMLYTYNEISDRQKTEKRRYTTKKGHHTYIHTYIHTY